MNNFENYLEVDTSKGQVNLTKMAQGFGKYTKDWLKLKSTKDYLSAYSQTASNADGRNLLTVIQGVNQEQGTWADKKIAIRFAQWLNPEFAVWVDSKLEELFTTGIVQVQAIDPSQAIFWQNLQEQNQLAQTYLQNALAKEQKKNQQLLQQNAELANRDLEVRTQKEYKWKNEELQNERGRTINWYVMQYFFEGDYSAAHDKAKDAYYNATGIRLPSRIKYASPEQKKDYLDWLSRYEIN